MTVIDAPMGACGGEMWSAQGPSDISAVLIHFHLRHPVFLGVLVGIAVFLVIFQQLAKVSKPIAAIWAVWSRGMHVVGDFQARVLLTLLYGIFVLPFGLAARMFSDTLRIKHPPTSWIETKDEPVDMQWAKRQ